MFKIIPSVSGAQSCLSSYKSTPPLLSAEAHLHACSHPSQQPSGPETCRRMPGSLQPGGSVSFPSSVQEPVSLYAQEAVIIQDFSICYSVLEDSGAPSLIQLSVLWFGHSRSADTAFTNSENPMRRQIFVLEGIFHSRHTRSSVYDSVKQFSKSPVSDRNLEQLDILFNWSYPGNQHTLVSAPFSLKSWGTKYIFYGYLSILNKHNLRIVSLSYNISTAALFGCCGSISAFILK